MTPCERLGAEEAAAADELAHVAGRKERGRRKALLLCPLRVEDGRRLCALAGLEPESPGAADYLERQHRARLRWAGRAATPYVTEPNGVWDAQAKAELAALAKALAPAEAALSALGNRASRALEGQLWVLSPTTEARQAATTVDEDRRELVVDWERLDRARFDLEHARHALHVLASAARIASALAPKGNPRAPKLTGELGREAVGYFVANWLAATGRVLDSSARAKCRELLETLAILAPVVGPTVRQKAARRDLPAPWPPGALTWGRDVLAAPAADEQGPAPPVLALVTS